MNEAQSNNELLMRKKDLSLIHDPLRFSEKIYYAIEEQKRNSND